MSDGFTHLDDRGNARMVDVTAKARTARRAVARCRVVLGRRPSGGGPDPDVLSEARLAGATAAKRTAELIPLCHPILLDGVTVTTVVDGDAVEIMAVAETVGQTGVEMEALTACALAALSVASAHRHDTDKPVIEGLALWEKSGGRSRDWRRTGPDG